MAYELIAAVVSFLLGLVLGHRYWPAAIKTAKDAVAALDATVKAIEDGKLTPEETEEIHRRLKELLKRV